MMPAFAKTISKPLPVAATTPCSRCRSAATVTSPRTAVALGPNIVSAASSSGARRPMTTTVAPSSINRRAVASPMPLLPPVMTAVLPAKRDMITHHLKGAVHNSRPACWGTVRASESRAVPACGTRQQRGQVGPASVSVGWLSPGPRRIVLAGRQECGFTRHCPNLQELWFASAPAVVEECVDVGGELGGVLEQEPVGSVGAHL